MVRFDSAEGLTMGTVTRFPQERVDYSRSDGLEPIGGNRGATILVLPTIRIERDDSPLLCEDAYADGDCGHLAIRTSGDPRQGSGYCESAWEPTPAELEQLNAGGSIILRVVGWQPPVALYVEKAEHALEPVHAPMVSPQSVRVCPRCELETGPLMSFCQNKGCPMR